MYNEIPRDFSKEWLYSSVSIWWECNVVELQNYCIKAHLKVTHQTMTEQVKVNQRSISLTSYRTGKSTIKKMPHGLIGRQKGNRKLVCVIAREEIGFALHRSASKCSFMTMHQSTQKNNSEQNSEASGSDKLPLYDKRSNFKNFLLNCNVFSCFFFFFTTLWW